MLYMDTSTCTFVHVCSIAALVVEFYVKFHLYLFKLRPNIKNVFMDHRTIHRLLFTQIFFS